MVTLYTMLLDDIIFQKRQEVTALKARLNVERVKQLVAGLPKPRDFLKALAKPGRLALIAEIKKASPSAGVLLDKYEPVYLAKTYEENGAAALSVLTDERFFQGRLDHIKAAKDSTTIPVLRKDFIIDETQVYESRVAGADAILLIARILTDDQLKAFLALAHELKMHGLVEVHNEQEAERALKTGAAIIGINNRDLDSLEVDCQTTLRLLEKLPELKERVVVSESGLKTAADIKTLTANGVKAVLVGESLLKSPDIGAKIKEMIG